MMECRYLVLLGFSQMTKKIEGRMRGIKDQKIASLDGIEVKGCYYAAFCKQIIEK